MNATHFSGTARAWSVPPSGLPDGFVFTDTADAFHQWDTFDLDGDRKPDLIHTADPATGQVWRTQATGDAYWKVYLNTGNGFAQAPVLWKVPDSGVMNGFFATHSATKFEQWATFDLDGDDKPDLVQSTNPATGEVWPSTPNRAWKVFKNTGAAFAPTATTWSVPTAPSGLPGGYNAKDSAANPKAWSTFDLTGDKLPDLVLTSINGNVFSPSVNPQWRLHRNTGTGFASTYAVWTVPTSGGPTGFTMPNSAEFGRQWATLDLEGDGLPDLVHTAATNDIVFALNGMAFWRYYKNLGTGFPATFAVWPVPPNGAAEGFNATQMLGTSLRWTTRDLTGDGRPDLIHTTNPATSQVWNGGAAGVYWNYYPNSGGAFVSPPVTWAVPESGLGDGFYAHVSNMALQRWVTFDLDGDGYIELVHTSNTAMDSIWTQGAAAPIWKLYRREL